MPLAICGSPLSSLNRFVCQGGAGLAGELLSRVSNCDYIVNTYSQAKGWPGPD